MVEVILIIVFIVGISIGCASDESAKKKIRKFDKRLTDFEKVFYGEVLMREDLTESTKDFEYIRLESMPNRLYKLESCFQCQLYRDKVLEDILKNPQEST